MRPGTTGFVSEVSDFVCLSVCLNKITLRNMVNSAMETQLDDPHTLARCVLGVYDSKGRSQRVLKAGGRVSREVLTGLYRLAFLLLWKSISSWREAKEKGRKGGDGERPSTLLNRL